MKIIEIILKVVFLALAVFLFVTSSFTSAWLTAFLVTSFILGLVLIFNKHESYGYPAVYSRIGRVYLMRRIEGVILIAFAVIIFIFTR